MSKPLHLAEALSQTLIAFTVEFDNEWEEKCWLPMQAKPLRVSMVMWENFLRFVPAGGITLRELSAKAGYPKGKAHPCIAGMLRWRFVSEGPSKGGNRSKLDQIIRLTPVGREAAKFWKPLAKKIEKRWKKRFRKDKVEALRQSLVDLVEQFETPLPHYFPVLGHLDGMRAPAPYKPDSDLPQKLSLPNLLSQTIHNYTISCEKGSEVSLLLPL